MKILDERVIYFFNAGDKLAFETIFHTFYPPLCYFVGKIVRNSDSANDIVQEIFINIWVKNLKFENIIFLRAYLYKSARNRAFSHLEQLNTRNELGKKIETINSIDEYDIFLYKVETNVFEQIFSAIGELPEECRRIFKMSYLENMDVKTIEERLGITAATIMTQRQRAKKYLKDRLKGIDSSFLTIFSIL